MTSEVEERQRLMMGVTAGTGVNGLNDTKVIPSFTIWIIHKKYTQFQCSNRSSRITLSNMKNDCGTRTVSNATVRANQSTVASSQMLPLTLREEITAASKESGTVFVKMRF